MQSSQEESEVPAGMPPGPMELEPSGLVQAKAFFRRLGPAGPLALISASMPFIAGFVVLGSLPWVGGWMQANRQTGGLLYFSVFAALGGLGFMPTHAYSALGGYAFGFQAGLALALGSYLAAAMIAYGIARLASGERVVEMIAEHPKSKAVYRALLGSGLGKTLLVTFLIRLTSSPFAITNMVMAATRVHPVIYAGATVVGMAPRTAALAYIASLWALQGQDLQEGSPLWLTVTFTVVTIVVLGILGHLGNQAIARVTACPESERPVRM